MGWSEMVLGIYWGRGYLQRSGVVSSILKMRMVANVLLRLEDHDKEYDKK